MPKFQDDTYMYLRGREVHPIGSTYSMGTRSLGGFSYIYLHAHAPATVGVYNQISSLCVFILLLLPLTFLWFLLPELLEATIAIAALGTCRAPVVSPSNLHESPMCVRYRNYSTFGFECASMPLMSAEDEELNSQETKSQVAESQPYDCSALFNTGCM